MQFSPGGGYTGAAILNTSQPVWSLDQEQAEHARRAREAQPEHVSTYKSPALSFSVTVNGRQYTARPHPRYGCVIDLPTLWVNQNLQNVQLPIGGNGDFVQFCIDGAPEMIGTFAS